jgi:HK97 gp10 family phage protein
MIPFQVNVTNNINIPAKAEQMKAAIWQTVHYAAQKIMLEAKAYCPVRTGRLQNSIKISDIAGGKAVGPDTPYDIYVEFGTRKMSAQPYIRPSIDSSGKAISDFLARVTNRALA